MFKWGSLRSVFGKRVCWGQDMATEQSENYGPLTEVWVPEAESISIAGKAGKMSGYTKAHFPLNILSLFPR